MTQKQTDYDKAFDECNKESKERFDFYNFDALHFVFRKGYECGRKQSTADHERNLIALGDDYMTARKNTIQTGLLTVKGKSIYEAYRLGWNDSDAFDDEWTAQHPKDLLSRILDSHPEIIEDEVNARMADIRNETKENEDAFASASNNISQNIADCDICSDKSLMRAEFAKAAMQGYIASGMMPDKMDGKDNFQTLAEVSVRMADALIAELDKNDNADGPDIQRQ